MFWNIIKERVSFAKRLERVGGLFRKYKERQGVKGKSALFFLSPATETREGEGS